MKVEFWAETRSAESAETTMKERILKKLLVVVIVELVTANTLADGSVSVLSEAGQGELVVVRMDADRSASSRSSWTDDRSEGISRRGKMGKTEGEQVF